MSNTVKVTCKLKVSDKCVRTHSIGLRSYRDNLNRNSQIYRCLYCSRHLKSGDKNPNTKYRYDRNFMYRVDTEDKAYLLGWIASDGSIEKGIVTLAIDKVDIKTLSYLRDTVSTQIPITMKGGTNLVQFRIYSQNIVNDMCSHLGITPGKKAKSVKFPELGSKLQPHFIKGLFEGDGTVSSLYSKNRKLQCSIASSSAEMKESLKNICGIKCSVYKGVIEWYGKNAMEFLDYIYEDSEIYLDRKYYRYREWKTK